MARGLLAFENKLLTFLRMLKEDLRFGGVVPVACNGTAVAGLAVLMNFAASAERTGASILLPIAAVLERLRVSCVVVGSRGASRATE